jgi:hypothetical protein
VPGAVEKQRSGIKPGHPCAALGEPVGDTALSPCEVEDGNVRLELQQRQIASTSPSVTSGDSGSWKKR